MSEWVEKPLGKLVSFKKGKKVETSDLQLDGFLPYLGASSLTGGEDGFALPNGGISCVASDALMLWDGERSGLVGPGKSGVISSTVMRLRPEAEMTGRYLVHCLRDRFEWIQARRTGTGVPHVPKDLGRILELRFPEAELEQNTICNILDALDTQIEATEGLIAKQERVRAGLMQDLFTRGVDEHGQLRPPREAAPHLYHQTELGWLPLGWQAMTLAGACSVIRDGTHLPPPRSATGPLLLSVRNMIDGGFQLTPSDERVPDSFFEVMHRNWRIRAGDTLLAIVGATIGKTCQVPRDFPKFTLQRSVCVLRGETGLLEADFLAMLIQRPEFFTEIWSRANQTAQPGVYLDQIAKIAVPIPSLQEQQLICAPMENVSNCVAILKTELAKLRLQKSGLMQDLLTGKVSVAPLLEGVA